MSQPEGVVGRRQLLAAARFFAVATLLSCAATWVGWRWNAGVLRSWLPGGPLMALATSLCLSLGALGLLALTAGQARRVDATLRPVPRIRWLSMLPAMLILVLLGMRGLALHGHWVSDFDGLSVEGPIVNAMSPATAFALTLTAVGQMVSMNRRFAPALQIIVITNIACVLLLLMTVLTAASQLPAIQTMAVPTAVDILLLNLGVLATNPDTALVRYLNSRHAGGQLLRSILAPALLLPALTVMVGRYCVDHGVLPPLSVTAVDTWLLGLLVTALVWWTAVKLDRGARELSRVPEYAAECLDSIACAVVLVDQRGQVEFVNRTASRMFKYDLDRIGGGPVATLLPGLADNWPGVTGAAAENPRPMLGQRGDGTAFPVEVVLSPLTTATGPKILATVIDATAVRDATERDARLAAIVTSSVDAIIGLSPDGTVTFWNESAEHVYGYGAEEMIGRSISVLLPEPCTDEDQVVARVIGGEHVDRLLVKRRTKQGVLIDVSLTVSPIRDPSGRIIGAAKIARDATAWLALQAAAASQQLTLKTLLETASDGLHVLDTEGNLVFFSDSFAELLGYTKEETHRLNVHDWELMHHDQTLEEFITEVTLQPSMVERRIRRKDGSIVDVELNVRGVWLDQRNYLYCSARDVTQRKRADREAQHYVAELERINGELDQFVYVASHDLRSPLRAVISLVQWIIQDDETLSEATKNRLELVQSRVQRLSKLLDDIRDYARSRNALGDSGPIQTAAELVADLSVTLGREERFGIVADPSLTDLKVSRMPLDRVLYNLIDNAMKHHDKPQGTVTIAATVNPTGYRFTVADDGPGIPEKYRSSVFELFKTLRPRDEVEGSGMGLALIRKIVEQRGGRCGMLPNGDCGAIFWFDWQKPAERSAELS